MGDYVLQNLAGDTNPAWVAARRGCLSASRFAEIMKKGRGGKPSETRYSYAKHLAAERLTGHANNNVNPNNPDIKRGQEQEPIALAEYELLRGVILLPPAWHTHPTIEFAGATPDGEVRNEGLVQVKSPRADKAIGYFIDSQNEFPEEYRAQMEWELAVRPQCKWNDLVIYNDDLRPAKCMHIWRLERDNDRIAELEEQARTFLAEVEHIFQVMSEMETT